ncbi:unnamed protein product [Linum trigynum]|uniref:RING-type domain-containing protein n=1 Tax=Linum trigynum TaxID=586398 RepID=A0AAV2DIP6_9ROSI
MLCWEMGSSGSKPSSGGASSSSGGGGSAAAGTRRKCRSKGSKSFQSYCLGRGSGSRDSNGSVDDHVFEQGSKDDEIEDSSDNQTEGDQVKVECCRKVKVQDSDDVPCLTSNTDNDEWSQASVSNTASRTASSSARAVSPSRFLSRFSFIPGNVSFRLGRATSLGSSRALPSSTLRMSNDDEEICAHPASADGRNDVDESRQDPNVLPASSVSRTSARFRINNQLSDSLDRLQPDQAISSDQYSIGNERSTHVWVDRDLDSSGALNDLDGIETRLADRRTAAREPVERNVRFSRTLSVGRLRDRVLRRSALSDMSFCPLPLEREERDGDRGNRAQHLGGRARAVGSELDLPVYPNGSDHPSSGMPNSLFGIQDVEVQTSRSREDRYHDLLEHRSNFLERRRRIRSQVRALQRLGSRFENMSGHGRSCILSGQHRTGRCTCRLSNRDANLNDDTSARASISRIVMLAEALFEVLDEIHQQSVVLSSRPSVSSLGSVPAPNEVVESLPVKLYTKSQKQQNDEAAQCYICLVEYDEGECMRVLPCHHEFHRACIDKWLKEIHRVCPLCRGDICRQAS